MELTLHQHLPVNLEESILFEDYEIYISNEVADNVRIVDNNKKKPIISAPPYVPQKDQCCITIAVSPLSTSCF